MTAQILCSANCEMRELLIPGVEAFIALNPLLVEVRGLQIRCGRNCSKLSNIQKEVGSSTGLAPYSKLKDGGL